MLCKIRANKLKIKVTVDRFLLLRSTEKVAAAAFVDQFIAYGIYCSLSPWLYLVDIALYCIKIQ